MNTANKLTIKAERFDKFTGEIKLKIIKPQGFKFMGADTIPANCNQADFTITGELKKDRPIENLVIEGSAGKFKTRLIAGDEAMQAFAYTHINPAQTFPVRVVGKGSLVEFQKIKNNQITLGRKPVTLTAKLVNGYIPPNVSVKLEILNKPDWIQVVSAPESKTKLVKYTVKSKVKVKGKGKGKNSWKVVTTPRTRLEIPQFQMTLKAAENSAGKTANLLVQASWVVTPKPDKRGKVRKYTQQLLLPVLRVQGGKN